jgi:Tol biopolymer transport system component
MGFFERYKKILSVLAFLATVFFLGYMLYITFFKSATEQAVEPTQEEQAAGLPQSGLSGNSQVASGEPGKLGETNNQPQSPASSAPNQETTAISDKAQGGITKTEQLTDTPGSNIKTSGNNVRYYDPSEGKFYSIDKNGQKVQLSDKIFYNVRDVTWSPVQEKAVIEYPDNSKIIYDFEQEKQITLPKHWEDFSFSPTGENIVLKSLGNDPDNRWLAVTKSDGSGVKALEQIGDANSIYADWSPNQQIIAMYTSGGGLDSQDVYFVGQNGENFKSTTVEGRDFRPLWSPEGDKLLYSVYSQGSDLKPSLWVVDAQGNSIGNNRQELKLETWADKCTFANSQTLYCAVPESLEKGAGMFPQMAAQTPDTIYKINVKTGYKEKVAIPEGEHTINEITTSEDGKTLFFNDSSGLIFKINL